MLKKRIYLFLFLALVLAMLYVPGAHAALGVPGAVSKVFMQLNSFLNSEWIIYGMVFFIMFILFYAIFAAGLARVKIFEGEHGLSKQGKIVGICFSALTVLSIFYFTYPPGPQAVLTRILPMFGLIGGIAWGLIIFSLVYYGFGEATGGKNWRLALFSAGFGMILAGMLMQSPELTAWGWIFALIGGIAMLISMFSGGGGHGEGAAPRGEDENTRNRGTAARGSRQSTVHVHVRNANDNQPVGNARVGLHRRGMNLPGHIFRGPWIDMGTTTPGGECTFTCRPGRRAIWVDSPGYHPRQEQFRAPVRGEITLNVYLNPRGGGGGGEVEILITAPGHDAPHANARRPVGDPTPMRISGLVNDPNGNHYDYVFGLYDDAENIVSNLMHFTNVAPGTEQGDDFNFTNLAAAGGQIALLAGVYDIVLFAQLADTGPLEAPMSLRGADIPANMFWMNSGRRRIQIGGGPPPPGRAIEMEIIEPPVALARPDVVRQEHDINPVNIAGRVIAPVGNYDFAFGIYNLATRNLEAQIGPFNNRPAGPILGGNFTVDNAPLPAGGTIPLAVGDYLIVMFARNTNAIRFELPARMAAAIPPGLIPADRHGQRTMEITAIPPPAGGGGGGGRRAGTGNVWGFVVNQANEGLNGALVRIGRMKFITKDNLQGHPGHYYFTGLAAGKRDITVFGKAIGHTNRLGTVTVVANSRVQAPNVTLGRLAAAVHQVQVDPKPPQLGRPLKIRLTSPKSGGGICGFYKGTPAKPNRIEVYLGSNTNPIQTFTNPEPNPPNNGDHTFDYVVPQFNPPLPPGTTNPRFRFDFVGDVR